MGKTENRKTNLESVKESKNEGQRAGQVKV